MPLACQAVLKNKPAQLLLLIIAILLHIAIQIAHLHPEDFCPNYYAAKNFTRNISIYSPVPCHNLVYNPLPPTATFLYLPFIGLPLQLATTVWSLLSLAAYLVAGILLLHIKNWLSIRSAMLFVVGSLFWSYLLTAGMAHNIGQLFFLLFVIAYLLKKSNHLYLSGIILGILTLIKLWPFTLILGALLMGQKKVFIAGLLTIILGFLVSLTVFKPAAYTTYTTQIYKFEESWLNNPMNTSLIGTTMKLFTGFVPYTRPLLYKLPFTTAANIGYTVSILVALSTFCFIYWQSKKNKSGKHLRLLEGLLITNALLISPLIWDWNVILLLLPVAILLKNWKNSQSRPLWLYGLCLLSLIAIFNPGQLMILYHYKDHAAVLGIESLTNMFLTAGIISLSLAQISFIIINKE